MHGFVKDESSIQIWVSSKVIYVAKPLFPEFITISTPKIIGDASLLGTLSKQVTKRDMLCYAPNRDLS